MPYTLSLYQGTSTPAAAARYPPKRGIRPAPAATKNKEAHTP